MADIGILTNARAADQRSMIGYGELLLEAARGAGYNVTEFRGTSLLSRLMPGRVGGRPIAKLLGNLDRFGVTPLALAGRRAAIVHVVDPGNVPYLNVIRHRASIVTVHDVIPYLCAEGRLEGFRPTPSGRRLMATILSRLKRVDRIVCVSDNTRRDLLSLVELDPGRVVTIPNAVFQPMRPATQEECAAVRARFGLPADGAIILHVGSISFYKNRPMVLEVFARLAPMHPEGVLLFVGPRSPDLVERARALGLAGRVHFAERAESTEMAALYSAASVLLFPSLYEGFGYPVLEAQLCGTPVVCSNAGSLAEVGGSAVMTAEPRDVNALALAVDKVLADPEVREHLRRAGMVNARRFGIECWRKAHDHVYGSVMASENVVDLVPK
jgi:glycosyltransferase involved in cell wall biosynthesis